MNSYENILTSAQTKFTKVVKKPEKFLQREDEIFEDIKLLSKVLYDVGKITEGGGKDDTNTLPELIINQFDEEQVWAGIELHNQNKLEKWKRKINKADFDENSSIYLKVEKNEDEKMEALVEDEYEPDEDLDDNDESEDEEENEEQDNDQDDDFMNDPDFLNMSDSEGDDLPLFDTLSDEDKSDDDTEDTYKARENKLMKEKASKVEPETSTEVDDQFFKLREMEKFLEAEDKNFEGKNIEDENDDEDIDMFEDIVDEDDETGAMYSQYFRGSGLPSNNVDDSKKSNVELDPMLLAKIKADRNETSLNLDDKKDKKVGNEEENDESDDEKDVEDESENENTLEHSNENKVNEKMDLLDNSDDEEDDLLPESTHQKNQARLKKKIDNMEAAAIEDKPWQLGGEVAAPVRPENSLLAEDLDYESGIRAAPLMTEAVARKLDDIIIQRIKDQAWDDVQRKVKPIESAQEYKKKLILDQEKNKLSLSQVYEQEYLKIAQAQEKVSNIPGLLDKDTDEIAVPLEVKQIKEDMRALFVKLDTLTHNHYVPNQKTTELKIVNNIASINMEEVAPVGASNATLLAPAEVVDSRKGELMTEGDKTKTDRKRERRQKKVLVKAKLNEKARKEKEKLSSQKDSVISKKSAMKEIENAEKRGKLKTVKETDKNSALKSSTAFFNVLQDEVTSNIKSVTNDKKKRKGDKKVSLAALKL